MHHYITKLEFVPILYLNVSHIDFPKTFTAWTNKGTCVADGDDPTCGAGVQAQIRTCIDGDVDICIGDEELLARTVSCSDAGTELPSCPGII